MLPTDADERKRRRARQPPERAAEIRAEDAAAHRGAYTNLTPEQLEQRNAALCQRRADERAQRPLFDRFESDPAAAVAMFRDSSGSMLHEDRAAAAGLGLRDYLLQGAQMGAVSTETLHKCIKAYLDQMGTTVVIKVCAVCGEQLFQRFQTVFTV